MKRLLLIVLLAGCAQQERVQLPSRPYVPTPVVRHCDCQCEPIEPIRRKLRQAMKDAAEWKRYAESLEQLPAVKPDGAHP
ncbi:hypothetical protein A6723_024230 [Pseudomonas sp. AU11447]|nr:hypothetical protein A6723_024230 [Pseudomonas sp. AU11447]